MCIINIVNPELPSYSRQAGYWSYSAPDPFVLEDPSNVPPEKGLVAYPSFIALAV